MLLVDEKKEEAEDQNDKSDKTDADAAGDFNEDKSASSMRLDYRRKDSIGTPYQQRKLGQLMASSVVEKHLSKSEHKDNRLTQMLEQKKLEDRFEEIKSQVGNQIEHIADVKQKFI